MGLSPATSHSARAFYLPDLAWAASSVCRLHSWPDSVPDVARAPSSRAAAISVQLGQYHRVDFSGWPSALSPRNTLFLLGSKRGRPCFLRELAPAFLCVFILRRVKEPEKWAWAREAGAKTGIKFGSYAVLLRDPKWLRRAWLGLILCSAGIVGSWGIGNFHPKIVRSIIAV